MILYIYLDQEDCGYFDVSSMSVIISRWRRSKANGSQTFHHDSELDSKKVAIHRSRRVGKVGYPMADDIRVMHMRSHFGLRGADAGWTESKRAMSGLLKLRLVLRIEYESQS